MPRFRPFPTLAVTLLLTASPLLSQTDTTQADSTRKTALPTFVVTAQRREESAQKVGLALTALSGAQLTERGVSRPNDVQRVVPSLEIEPAFGGGQAQYRLRGIGFSDYAANNSSTVAVYLDNVAMPFAVQTQGLLFDLERVEVLRGPQGTLYGRNSTGGAVNYISSRPTAATHTGLNLDIGSFGAINADAFLSGSLSTNIRGRLSVATNQGGGWQYNRVSHSSLGDRNQSALRAQLEWYAHPRVNLLFSATGAVDRSEGQGLYLFAPFGVAGGTGTTLPADVDHRASGWGLRPEFATVIDESPSAKPGRDNNTGGASVQAKIDLGSSQLTSITAYNALSRRESGDWDATSSAESDEAFHSRIGVFSQEVRLASRDASHETANTSKFDWLTGAYLSNERLNERFYSDFTNFPGIAAAALTTYKQSATAAALFGQVGWKFSPQWKAVGGVRVEYEQRALEGLTTGFISPPLAFVPPTDRSLITREPSSKVALEFTPSSRVLTYVSASRGIKSGGFTAYNTTNIAQLNSFEPEVLNALEVGVKAEPTRALRVNAALYHYQYLNQQVLSTVYDQVSKGPIGRIANAKRSRIDGGELELEWQVTPHLTLSQFAGVVAGQYQDFITVDAQASITAGREVSRDFSGTALNIPRVSAGGAATYAFLLGQFGVRANVNYSVRDKQQASRLIFTPEYDVPGYTLLNASATLSRTNSHWSAQVWSRNIADREYDLTRNFFINAKVAAAGAPATVGVRVSYAR